jgi:hypothetical protein
MARKMASFRLDVELLDWAKSYAESRGETQAMVIEAGLRSVRDGSVAAVPDLPVVNRPAARPVRSSVAVSKPVPSLLGLRQRNLDARRDGR